MPEILHDQGSDTKTQSWIDAQLCLSDRLIQWIDEAGRTRGQEPSQLKLLSVNAGLGMVEIPVADIGYEVTLHHSEESGLAAACKTATSRGLKLKTAYGDLASLPPRSFDLVFLGSCDQPPVSGESLDAVIQSCRQLLVPGGNLVILTSDPRKQIAGSVRNAGLTLERTEFWRADYSERLESNEGATITVVHARAIDA